MKSATTSRARRWPEARFPVNFRPRRPRRSNHSVAPSSLLRKRLAPGDLGTRVQTVTANASSALQAVLCNGAPYARGIDQYADSATPVVTLSSLVSWRDDLVAPSIRRSGG